MFLGAMIMGPLAAYAMKRIDAIWEGKIRPGFEMLVNNVLGRHLGAFDHGDRRLLRRWPAS